MAFQGAKVVNLFFMAKCLTLYFSCFIDSFFYCTPREAIFACLSRDYLQKNSSIKNCVAIFHSTYSTNPFRYSPSG